MFNLFGGNNKLKTPKTKPNEIVNGKDVYVIDTNVPLLNPKFYDLYNKGTVFVIPFMVIKELNAKKASPDKTLAVNAREFNRVISDISDKKFDSGKKYIEHKGYLFRIKNVSIDDNPNINKKAYTILKERTNDDFIVATALTIKSLESKSTVIMLSNDVDVRVRANELGIKSVRFNLEDVQSDCIYDAIPTIEVDDNTISNLYTTGIRELEGFDFIENSGAILVTKSGKRIPTRVKDGAITNLKFYIGQGVSNLKALDEEQAIFLDALLDPNVMLISNMGRSGTGKTLLTIAAALQLQEDRKYDKIWLIKGTKVIGDEIGYLPGSLEEKTAIYKMSFEDSFDIIGGDGNDGREMKNMGQGKAKVSYLDSLIDMGSVIFSTPQFMRGISKGLGKKGDIVCIDESQGLSPHEMKSIITRFGANTKIILLGDVRQIDSRFLTSRSNGLAVVADKLNGQTFFANIMMKNSKRNERIDIIDDLLS